MADTQTNGSQATASLLSSFTDGAYIEVLTSTVAKDLITRFTGNLQAQTAEEVASPTAASKDSLSEDEIAVGLAALNAFLQSNVTGPVLEHANKVEALFTEIFTAHDASASSSSSDSLKALRRSSLKALEVDGVSPYPYIPHIELFALARYVFHEAASASEAVVQLSSAASGPSSSSLLNLPWTRLRVNVWHFKLLSQPSLGPGANFAKASQWIDVPTLAEQINLGMEAVRKQILDEDVWSTGQEVWSREDQVQFLLEVANTHIMLGRDDRAREALEEATKLNNFAYALSGALGKRTKFQEKSTSQLVVLAKSDATAKGAETTGGEEEAKPEAVALNDDTLLEEIQFSKEASGKHGELAATSSGLPAALADLSPEAQPQLSPLDQIILLTEATLKDTFSPVDTLTSEEVLPYAVRVVSDKVTNWQIYSQALLVRSRIEVHRSRTVERGVLQMQAVVDQVVVDTSEAPRPKAEDVANEPDVPAIAVSAPGETDNTAAAPVDAEKPTSFFPAAKETDTAPAHVRLQYIHALSSPPKWHLESELAYAWAGVGSLVSALEIFKRLRLWAEVALCLASSASTDDDSGRGNGGEDKAKALVRWRLFHRTGQALVENADPDAEDLEARDVTYLNPADFTGPERSPPPPNAPRLFCILGDLENEPAHWERAWEISNRRFARAQKSLGEWYLSQKEWVKAQDAYKLATKCNRLSPEMWSRLGDISLRLGQFPDAAEAYGRAIGAAGDVVGGEDARTWSNLGSSLWSMYLEAVEEVKKQIIEEKKNGIEGKVDEEEDDVDDDDEEPKKRESKAKDPATLLSQSLAAYKRGASIAQDNWRIWDNVLTLASRVRPPAVTEMVQALRAIIRIRNTEDALDDDVLRALLQESVLTKEKEHDESKTGVYTPPRGTVEKAVIALLEESVAPLITTRSELWELIVRARVWRRDYAGAVDAAEKAWRAAMGAGAGGGLMASAAGSGGAGDDQSRNWLADRGAWKVVVARTDELVSVLENFGGEVEGVGGRWRGKARNAVRSVMSRGREAWEGTEEWVLLEGMMEGLKL
ncbi:TPR repeat-containing protein [Colletotrichum orchidophilum]|uniref:TPR repeat-containing protein n=1 Tax=Colletotrichum orchidophilum TaxID=1209926 RepID=A0A1G4BN97_9PEZI|nr:TPR repeat-containing protein [Colletotrichum orchidophilum]OHF02940.1 TPR repeat-containing protein [Colletotrichum orchidophilum]